MISRIEIKHQVEFPEFPEIIKELATRIYPANRAFQRPLTLSRIHGISSVVLAYDEDNQVSGIAILYDNPDLQHQGVPAKCFGHFEAIDEQTALSILNAVCEIAANEGFEYLVGPMNGSTWDDYRINADEGSFELIPDNWYWPWYNESLVNNGFEIVSKYYSSVDELRDENYAPSYNRVIAKDDKNLKIRHINLEDLDAELLKASGFCNVAFQKNLFFTPITSADFADKYRPIMSRIESWQMLIAEYNGEMAGMLFAYTMPTEPKSLVLKTLARLPSSQFNDLGQALVYIMIQEARKRGYTKIVRAMMRYENGYWDAKKLSLGHIQKDYNLYIKKL